MATRIRFEFLGEEQIDRTLLRRGMPNVDELDARPLWEELADRFVKMEARQFRSVGVFGSGGWAPLSPRYARWKARHYPGKPILQREGDLIESLTTRPLGIEVLTASRMIVGTDVEYAKYHQAGGRHLPRRRPIEFRESERREWVKRIQRFAITGNVAGRRRAF